MESDAHRVAIHVYQPRIVVDGVSSDATSSARFGNYEFGGARNDRVGFCFGVW